MKGFSSRHIGISNEQKNYMLDSLGLDSIEHLISETIPNNIRLKNDLNLEEALSENEFLTHIEKLSKKNKNYKSFIGLGYNQSVTPSVIKRNILENPSWYTAYTPYQAEIAQGRMEALLNYQTIICDLTGMELSNASLLDESTSAAEAMTMLFSSRSREQKKENINKFFVSNDALKQTISLIETRAEPLGIEVVVGKLDEFDFSNDFYGCFMQYPGIHGGINDLNKYGEKAKSNGLKIVVAADIFALCLLKEPSNFGADVVVGTSQRFGIPLGYGGPHAAFFATKEEYKRSIPGRIIGLSKDVDDNPALRMALQTREQHIKRDRATSNICTSQVLLAVMASMYGVFHGPDGLKSIALKIHELTVLLDNSLKKIGIKQFNKNYFDTLLVKGPTEKIKLIAEENKINFNYIDDKHFSISINEATSLNDIQLIVDVVAKGAEKDSVIISQATSESRIPKGYVRESKFLQTKIFNIHHSETSLMRYIKNLERKDLSLTHSMISLGSCTMKLNAASEMLPITLPGFSNAHPFLEPHQRHGYNQMMKELISMLKDITGFDAVSLQPHDSCPSRTMLCSVSASLSWASVIRSSHPCIGAREGGS